LSPKSKLNKQFSWTIKQEFGWQSPRGHVLLILKNCVVENFYMQLVATFQSMIKDSVGLENIRSRYR